MNSSTSIGTVVLYSIMCNFNFKADVKRLAGSNLTINNVNILYFGDQCESKSFFSLAFLTVKL